MLTTSATSFAFLAHHGLSATVLLRNYKHFAVVPLDLSPTLRLIVFKILGSKVKVNVVLHTKFTNLSSTMKQPASFTAGGGNTTSRFLA